MITRQYAKIASSSRTLLRHNIIINRKYIDSLRLCNSYTKIQLRTITSSFQYASQWHAEATANRQKISDKTNRTAPDKTRRNSPDKVSRAVAEKTSRPAPEKSHRPATHVKANRTALEKPKDVKEPKEFKSIMKPIISSEEVLEKFVAGLNTDIYQKNRVYRNDFLRVLKKVKDLNFSTKKQGLLLIRCCTELMPDETAASRMAMVEEVWNTLMSHTTFEVEHYNELLKVYIANNRTLTVRAFIEKMAPVVPTITTYELILRALAEAGDLNQATEVIANMKAQGLPANESIFNSLIVCQGKSGNLQNIPEVLSMMKSLKINHTVDTYTALARALAWNKKNNIMLDKIKEADRMHMQFTEYHIMEIVKTLAAVSTYGSIPQVLRFLPHATLNTPSISPYMQSVTTLLVFQNHPIAALEIYKCLPLPSFGPKDDKGLHGRSLVRDCAKAAMPSSIIGLITQELMATGRNPIALQNAAEAALQLGKVPLALDMLTRMKQMGIPLRPHYFWPILLQNSKSYGEKGVMDALTIMVQMDVKPDYETIMEYTLPYVSFTSPQNLMKKFQETGLAVSSVLTPMMETLMNTGQVRAASEICELFQGKVDAEKLLKPLLQGYFISSDVKSTVHALEDITNKAMDKNKDWVGRFLCMFMQHKKVREDISDVLNLLKALNKTTLRISTIATDYCLSRIPDKYGQATTDGFKDWIINLSDEKIVDDGDIFDQQIPHPKQMNEESLRAHLIELEAKGMNTRGVLRRLLQTHCRDGNLPAAREIAAKCQKEGVFLSAGMKAAIFDLHVKLGELDLAEITLADLNKTSPNFTLDEFKVIDFATLMVYRKKTQQAMESIIEQSKKRKVMGGRGISMNCWRLLDATAAHGTAAEVREMFDLLVELKYCKPSNVLLGPMIRVHLKNDHLQEAVLEFVRIAEQYGKTPLKHELLCKLLHTMSDGQSEESFMNVEKTNGMLNKLVHTVLEIDKRIHGPGDVQLTLIAALADVNYKKTLRKMLLDPFMKFHPDALRRRCERFADDKKVKALENIAECAKDLRHIDVEEIYELIMDVHHRDHNYTAAMALWQRMQEADITPTKKFVKTLCSLIKYSNKDIPADLAALADKQEKKKVFKS